MQYGSAGAGSTTHLACSLLNSEIGVNVTHVPYRGSAPAANDLIGGQIDYLCGNLGAAAPLIMGKQVKAIAVLSKGRSPLMPDLASAHEQGLKDFDVTTWTAFFLPKGTPAADRRQAQRGHPRDHGDAAGEAADAGKRRHRRQPGSAIAGISRQIRRRRGGALGGPDQGRRTSGRLIP